MKVAHKYRLEVKFSKGMDWDLYIVAIDAENVTTFLPRDETDERYIINTTIELIERNFEEVKDNFCGKTL